MTDGQVSANPNREPRESEVVGKLPRFAWRSRPSGLNEPAMAGLLQAFRKWVDGFHVNASSLGERHGRRVVVKRRRPGGEVIMRLANLFFRAARNPVQVLTDRVAWRDWETRCFQRLHGPEYLSGVDPAGTAWIEVLPGVSLGDRLASGALSEEMMRAAGRELRRAHAEHCEHYGGLWSHGDPHTGNFIYDPTTQRARLIDFEVRHLREWPERDRHADDLLVLLQDVCGRCAADRWPALAAALLESYNDSSVTSRIRAKLRVPTGVPRLWWAVRTTWMRRPELERRLAELLPLLPIEASGLQLGKVSRPAE